MRVTTIATLAALAAGATITTQSGGLLAGETVPVLISSPSGAFVGTAQLQTSVDGITWTNVGPVVTTAGATLVAITLSNYLRLNASAYTSGNVSAVAFNAVG